MGEQMAVLCIPTVYPMQSLLFLILFSATLNAKASSCPRSCNCPNVREVHCTFRHLAALPSELPRASKRINLGYNSIKRVTASDFGEFLELEMLLLHGNDIKYLSPGAFYNLHHLQILKLSYNKLEVLYRGMFDGMTGLVRLHLDHNKLDFIEPFSFDGLTSLKLLQLDGNRLRDLHPYTFVTMSFLGKFVSSGLLHLHIAENDLRYLLPGTFKPLTKLESLSLHGNPWTCDCNFRWLVEWNEKHEGVIKCKKDSGNSMNCATCASPRLLDNNQVFQLPPERFLCKRPSIDSHLKMEEISDADDESEPDLPYMRDLVPTLGRLTFALSDSNENVAHAACDVGHPLDSTAVTWDTSKNAEVAVNVTLASLLECDIERDELHSMWRLIAYYYDSPALLDRGAKHENASTSVGFKYSQVVNEDAAYFTDLKGHLMAEPPWLLQPRISLQLNQRKTSTKKLVLNFATLITSSGLSHSQDRPSWALMERAKATRIHTVFQGSNVTFECGIQSSEERQVEWILPDATLLDKTVSNNIITEENSLHLNNVTLLDAGLYHCLVRSEVEVDAVSFRLAVRERLISASEINGKRITLESGSKLTLDCSISSTYPTETTWFLPNSKIMRPSQSNRRESVLQNNTLIIENVNHGDTGVYSCLSVNLYGVDMLSHHVVITGEALETDELDNINENQSSSTESETEGSAYDEFGYQLPKQQLPPEGKVRENYHSVKLSKSVQEMDGTYWPNEKDDENDITRSLAPHTQVTPTAYATDMTNVPTTTMAASEISTSTTNNEDNISSAGQGKQNISDKPAAEEEIKMINYHRTASNSKTDNTGTSAKFKLTNRLSKNATQIQRTFRRKRPLVRRPHPNRYNTSNKDTTPPDASTITTSGSETRNKNHSHVEAVDADIKGRHRFRNRNSKSPSIARQSNEYTKTEIEASDIIDMYASEHGLIRYDSAKLEENHVSRKAKENDSQTENVSIKEVSTKRNKLKQTEPSTTLSPRYDITTIDLPSSMFTTSIEAIPDIPTQRPRTVAISESYYWSIQQWPSLVTSHPKTTSWSVKPSTSTTARPPYSTTRLKNGSQGHIGYGRVKKPSISAPFTNTMANGLKPRITFTNTDVIYALLEGDAFLPCQAAGTPKPTISWRKTSTGTTIHSGLHQKETSKFEVLRNGTLMIKNIKLDDRGQYLCFAQNRFGVAHSVASLDVMTGTPKITRSHSKDLSLHLGDSVNLHCIVQGKPRPQISWILPDKTVLHEVGTYAVASLFPNGTLNLPSVTMDTEGHYQCIANNRAGKDSVTYNVGVIVSLPTINEKTAETLAVTLGTSVYMHCTAEGQPQPVIRWSLPNGPCSEPIRSFRKCPYVFPNGTLYIKSVSVTDGGRYECTATNLVGTAKRLLLLDTKVESYLPQENEELLISTEYGSTVYLYCSHHGPVWRLPSKKVLAHHYRSERFITAFPNGTLRIQHLSEKLVGTYTCMSQQPNAVDTHFQVEIKAKAPKLENTSVSLISVPLSETLQVDCIYSDVPNPEISWSLPDGTVIKTDQSNQRHLGRYFVFGNGTLLLKQITQNDEGDYRCYVKNASGEDEIKVSVRVVAASPTAAPKTQGSVMAELGKPAHMKCKSHGYFLSPVTWFSPNNSVISSTSEGHQIMKDGTLLIKKVSLRDEGRYTCSAQNSVINYLKLEVENKEPYINGLRGHSSKNILAVTFQTVLMDCQTEGKPEAHITWTTSSGSSMTAPYAGGRFQVHKNGSLELRGVRKSDEGQFKCFAKNDYGEAQLTVTLKVETLAEKPSFSNPNVQIYPIKSDGVDLTLDCSATGKPSPSFLWILPNNTQLNPGARMHRLRHFTGTGALHITSPVAADKGIYRCLARNVAGVAEKRYELRTGQKPYIRGNGSPVKVTFGQTMNLPCTVEGWPDASVSWSLPNGRTLVNPQDADRLSFQVNNTLQVKDVGKFDRGSYICKATNAYGSSFLSYPVTVVVYPPRITSAPPPIVKAYRGKSVTLNCVSDGIPKPDISWTLPGRTTLLSSSRFTAQGGVRVEEDGSLVIVDPGLMHSGIYKCNAKNLLGTDFKATYLQVV